MPAVPPPCLHDATGGQGVGDLAGAGWLAVLTHSLVAAAVGIPTPLHRPIGIRGQAAQNAGVDGQSSQAIVSEQHRLTPTCGAGDELVLGTGLIEDLQALLTHRVQAGKNAWTLSGKIVSVTTGGAVQGLAGHDGPWGRGRGSGGGGGGRAQHILIDYDVIHLIVELVVADFIGTGFALRQEALLPAQHGGRRGNHWPGRPCDVQCQVAAGLVDDDFPFAATIPCHSGWWGIAWLSDGHRALSGKLFRLNDLDGVHGDGDGLTPEAGHSHTFGDVREKSCISDQFLTPLPGCAQVEEDQTPSLKSAIRGHMGTDDSLHVSFKDNPQRELPSAWVFMRWRLIEDLSQSNSFCLLLCNS